MSLLETTMIVEEVFADEPSRIMEEVQRPALKSR